VLQVLLKMLNIELDMSELNKRAEDTEHLIKSIKTQAAAQAPPSQPMGMPSPDEKNLDYIS